MDIIDISIAVIVNAIVVNFTVIDPCVGSNIFMEIVHPVIHNGHHDGIAIDGQSSLGDVPGFIRINISIQEASGLTCIEPLPLGEKLGVIRFRTLFQQMVVLGDHYFPVSIELIQQMSLVDAAMIKPDQVDAEVF